MRLRIRVREFGMGTLIAQVYIGLLCIGIMEIRLLRRKDSMGVRQKEYIITQYMRKPMLRLT